MSQPPKVRQLGQGSLAIIGDGWSIQIRVVGWWRPRLLVSVHRDGPEPEIPHGEVEWQQAGWRRRGKEVSR